MSDEKKLFIARAMIWTLFACIIPVIFIGWRYDLIKKVGSLQLSGWGLVAVILIITFAYAVVKYIQAGFVEWSMTKQIVNGVVKIVLPLGALLGICIGLRENIDVFIQALSLVLISEVIAIPINPFPEWVYKKTKGRFEGMVDFVANRLYNKKEENKGE